MAVASSKLLGSLHGRLAQVMTEALEAEAERIRFTEKLYETDTSELDEATAKVIAGAIALAPSARVDNGLLKTVSAFLKDNNITADLGDGEERDIVTEQLNALASKRRVVSTPLDDFKH